MGEWRSTIQHNSAATSPISILPSSIYFYPYVIDAFQYFVLHSMDNFKGIVSRMLYGYGTDGKFGLE